MISLKQQIAYDIACDIAGDPEHHDPLPADVQRTIDAGIQESLAKLQAFMAGDTVKALTIVAVGQERTLATVSAVGGAAARLAMVMVDKGTEVAAEMTGDYVQEFLAQDDAVEVFINARAKKEFNEKESWND